jgi:hypothetical protein
MLPIFRHYRSVVEREPGSYMFECSGPDSLYPMCGPRGPGRIGEMRDMRDKLIRNGRTNADFIADSVWKESEATAKFMYDNAIKHFFANEGNRFVICCDQMNKCKDIDELYYDDKFYDHITDTTIIDIVRNESRTWRRLDRPWYARQSRELK